MDIKSNHNRPVIVLSVIEGSSLSALSLIGRSTDVADLENAWKALLKNFSCRDREVKRDFRLQDLKLKSAVRSRKSGRAFPCC